MLHLPPMFYWNGISSQFPLSTYVVFGMIFNQGQPNYKSMGHKKSLEKITYGGEQVALRGNINYVYMKSQI